MDDAIKPGRVDLSDHRVKIYPYDRVTYEIDTKIVAIKTALW